MIIDNHICLRKNHLKCNGLIIIVLLFLDGKKNRGITEAFTSVCHHEFPGLSALSASWIGLEFIFLWRLTWGDGDTLLPR